MRPVLRTPPALAALAGLVLGLPAALGAGDTKEVDVVVKTVKVHQYKNAKSDPWDADNSDPDLYVVVRHKVKNGKEYKTEVKENTLAHRFDSKAIRVKEGDTIEVKVYDKDLNFDDLVGEDDKLKITAKMIRDGKVDLKFGQVLSLVLTFEP